MTRTLTLRSITPVTHDTNRLAFDRPDDLDYTPGQAAHVALDQDGWRDEVRSFTMTSLPGEDQLEFRHRHALRAGDSTPSGQTLHASAGLQACLDALSGSWTGDAVPTRRGAPGAAASVRSSRL